MRWLLLSLLVYLTKSTTCIKSISEIPSDQPLGVSLNENLEIMSATDESPLSAGTRIVAVNGEKTQTLTQFGTVLRHVKSETEVFRIDVQTDQGCEQEKECDPVASFEISTRDPIGVSLDKTLKIVSVASSSPLQHFPVAIGDRIISVNREATTTLTEFGATLREIKSNDQTLTMTLEILLQHPVCTSSSDNNSGARSGTLRMYKNQESSDVLLLADYVQTGYGDTLSFDMETSLVPVLAQPLHACSRLENNVKGNLVMAIRGDCPFTEKSRHAMNAGASVLMIFNTEPGLPIVPGMTCVVCGPLSLSLLHTHTHTHTFTMRTGKASDNLVPSMVVTERTRREMRRLGVTQDSSSSSLRVKFEANNRIGMLWKELNKYLDVKKWPSESSEQKRKYHRLSLEHHPDKPGGSDERFEFLRYAYKKARFYSDPELQKSVYFDEYISGH